MTLPDIPCLTNPTHSFNVHRFYPPPSDQPALPLYIPPCLNTAAEEQPVHSSSHSPQLVIFPPRHPTTDLDLTKIPLSKVGPLSRPLELVGHLVLIHPISQDFLQLFLLLLFIRPLLYDLLNQSTVWLSSLGIDPDRFILRNSYTKVVDYRLGPGKEGL
jgi:hypothetical protein